MIPLSYNIRSLAVRKTTTLTTILGLALVVFVLAASQMLANGIHRTLDQAGDPLRAIVLRKGAAAETQSNIGADAQNIILSAPGVKRDEKGMPLGHGDLVFIMVLERRGGRGAISNVTIRGVRDTEQPQIDGLRVVEGRAPRPGSDEVMVGKRIAGRFTGVDLGESFEIKKNRPVQVVGVFEANGTSHESELIGGLDMVGSAFGMSGIISSVTVQLDSPERFDEFKSAIEGDKRLGLAALREVDYYEKQSDGTVKLVVGLGGAVTFLFSLGATIGAMITMYASVSRRKREIGTLRALGFPRRTILLSFLVEGVLMAAAGSLIGVIASLGTGMLRFSLLNLSSGAEISFSFDPSLPVALSAIAVGSFMGVLGGLLPAVAAARVPPTIAMRA